MSAIISLQADSSGGGAWTVGHFVVTSHKRFVHFYSICLQLYSVLLHFLPLLVA